MLTRHSALEVLGTLVEDGADVVHRGIVDQAVEPTVAVQRQSDDARPSGRVGHVRLEVDRTADVGGDNVPAAGTQQCGLGGTLATPGSGHDGDRTHGPSSWQRGTSPMLGRNPR